MTVRGTRYAMYEVMLYTQTGQMALRILVDTQTKEYAKHGCLREQYRRAMGGKWQLIDFTEANGGTGLINPNSVSFIGMAFLPDEAAERMLAEANAAAQKEVAKA